MIHRPHSRLAYRTPREVAAPWKDHGDHLTPRLTDNAHGAYAMSPLAHDDVPTSA
jgi:hypothetical protein